MDKDADAGTALFHDQGWRQNRHDHHQGRACTLTPPACRRSSAPIHRDCADPLGPLGRLLLTETLRIAKPYPSRPGQPADLLSPTLPGLRHDVATAANTAYSTPRHVQTVVHT